MRWRGREAETDGGQGIWKEARNPTERAYKREPNYETKEEKYGRHKLKGKPESAWKDKSSWI